MTAAISERQAELLQLIADGMTPKQAARELGIALKTAYNHLNCVYRQLNVESMTHAVVAAHRHGIIDLGEPAA